MDSADPTPNSRTVPTDGTADAVDTRAPAGPTAGCTMFSRKRAMAYSVFDSTLFG